MTDGRGEGFTLSRITCIRLHTHHNQSGQCEYNSTAMNVLYLYLIYFFHSINHWIFIICWYWTIWIVSFEYDWNLMLNNLSENVSSFLKIPGFVFFRSENADENSRLNLIFIVHIFGENPLLSSHSFQYKVTIFHQLRMGNVSIHWTNVNVIICKKFNPFVVHSDSKNKILVNHWRAQCGFVCKTKINKKKKKMGRNAGRKWLRIRSKCVN